MLTSSRPVHATKTSARSMLRSRQYFRRRSAANHHIDVEPLEAVRGFLGLVDDDDLGSRGEGLGQSVPHLATADDDDMQLSPPFTRWTWMLRLYLLTKGPRTARG